MADPARVAAIAPPRRATARAAGSADARLGERLRTLRRQRRLSQSDLAQVLGVTYQQVQKYETGKTRLPARMLPALADLLEVDSRLLLNGLQEEGPPTAPTVPSAAEARDWNELAAAFAALRQPRTRRLLLAIIRAMAAEARLEPEG
ncbi:helix-turn-helix domain-containing protein [Roseomonas sp. BU-1]|uniref:Helix-turn-helix domain-containing protein n=2 Tax=Falsiroseomonas selenitidurans TaxID=2716335 RepID=A0ABX1E1U0_9PROT|nr:helix-turn-helix domain-containing protein [Falsiroseomonas selenitidurans]